MSHTAFVEAARIARNPLADIERRCLVGLARRLPPWVSSDHLTALALCATALTGVSYSAARAHSWTLLLAVVGLGLNWVGDSLDGTVARIRRLERPRYGFYVDHVVDCFGAVFVLAGLAASHYMTPIVAMGLLIAYLMLSIEVYLATYCLAEFRLSFWGIGPTELRLVLAAGTVALRTDPSVEIFGQAYRLFDVGGAIAIAGLALTTTVSIARNVRALYRAEPLS